ncbi:MAG: LysR family transcriptional regulator [Deltaproteobacteria bacterium]|nr:LysR family transcriptional regulator [Deltaproteobacteria bacterium]
MVVPLNFHHLQYFWAVATDGNLTRTARRLRVSQSALSAQIRQLGEQLGQPLFERDGRGLVLTEAGKVVLVYAEEIFTVGGELVSTMREGRRRSHLLRVGAVATLSRNFQRSFVRPVLREQGFRLRLTSGNFEELLSQLQGHGLDVVLSNRPAPGEDGTHFRSRRLAHQPVSLVCSQPVRGFRFPRDLGDRPVILPVGASELRIQFDALCERLGVKLRIAAEVDDMATMRLLARDSEAVVLVPSVVVRDELRDGLVHELCTLPEVEEAFYAITVERRFQHPVLRELLQRDEGQLLDVLDESPLPRGVARERRRAPRAPGRGAVKHPGA